MGAGGEYLELEYNPDGGQVVNCERCMEEISSTMSHLESHPPSTIFQKLPGST